MLFFGKKNKEAAPELEAEKDVPVTQGVVVMGGGCAKCDQLEEATQKALSELGLDREVRHLRDFEVIASHGVLSTPALMVDGKVLFQGRVPSVKELKELLGQ
ncbi:MAG: thioredoxin family protein [Tissierellia bacterium]|nr:thioredoxin family protein [Tissierellia bacterium]